MLKRCLYLIYVIVLILSVTTFANTFIPKKVKAAIGPIETGFKPYDQALDPNSKIVYMTTEDSKTLYAVNYLSGAIKKLELPYPAERLEIFDNKLYVTQQKQAHDRFFFGTQEGGIAEVDLSTFKLLRVIDVKIDPFDIAIDKNGMIFISSGCGQHGITDQYSLKTNEEMKTQGNQSIFTQSYILWANSTSKLYSITNDIVTPRQIKALEMKNNTAVAGYSSDIYPSFKPYMKMTPDERYMYTQDGKVLDLSLVQSGDMKLTYDFKKEYNDYAFDLFNRLTFAASNGGIDVYSYDSNKFLYTLEKNVTVDHVLYRDGLIVSYTSNDGKHYLSYLTGTDKDTPNVEVNPVKSTDSIITGKTSPNVRVYADISSKNVTEGTATSNGTFTLKIPKQKVGTVITIRAKDSSGNNSKPINLKVVEKIPPVKTLNKDEYRESINLGFKPNDVVADPNRPIIYITKNGNKTLYSVNYETGIIKTLELPYPAERIEQYGDKLFVTQHKQSHLIYSSQQGGIAEVNLSNFSFVKYIELNTDPFDLSIDKNGIIYVSSGMRIIGGNSEVKVYGYSVPENKIIELSSKANLYEKSYLFSNPRFNTIYAISTSMTSGSLITIDVNNANWDESNYQEFNGSYTKLAKISPEGLAAYSASGNVYELVSGKLMWRYNLENKYNDYAFDPVNNLMYGANQNGGIDVFNTHENNRLYTIEKDISAEYLIYNNGLITIYKDLSDNYYLMAFKTENQDKPRLSKVNEISNLQSTIIGVASPNVTVHANVNSKEIGATKADIKGHYVLTIPIQKAGAVVNFYVTDKENAKSKIQSLVVKDRIAPLAPTITKSSSTSLSGKSEIGSTVNIYSGSTLLKKGITNSKGEFVMSFSKQKKGTSLRIFATDKANNKSTEKVIKIN
ncbi:MULTISPECIES: Ig-like domain-containing protein [unclassified Bacillus (in: firmicutes)]|uniref:Ig-like domain-containing protein n=1 Tax=unclassified Bacillus (in: firmicutes) TaxID=185979 RepID=UPI000BF048D2|nr:MULTISPECIES: Ig-like domain-containing protein [unclassified Bacillus (in: firmicutes)]PEJ53115.1 hypothetical protein CN692_21620 [Bacillus sp. AFS002410]PEL13714.1 hypothetical protein CN601_03100 [Bacillus sp. AFS017336]